MQILKAYIKIKEVTVYGSVTVSSNFLGLVFNKAASKITL